MERREVEVDGIDFEEERLVAGLGFGGGILDRTKKKTKNRKTRRVRPAAVSLEKSNDRVCWYSLNKSQNLPILLPLLLLLLRREPSYIRPDLLPEHNLQIHERVEGTVDFPNVGPGFPFAEG